MSRDAVRVTSLPTAHMCPAQPHPDQVGR